MTHDTITRLGTWSLILHTMADDIRATCPEIAELVLNAAQSCADEATRVEVKPVAPGDVLAGFEAITEAASVVARFSETCIPAEGEPCFVLLARDPQAADMVEAWARVRVQQEPDVQPEKIANAYRIAAAMRAYGKPPVAHAITDNDVADVEAAFLLSGVKTAPDAAPVTLSAALAGHVPFEQEGGKRFYKLLLGEDAWTQVLDAVRAYEHYRNLPVSPVEALRGIADDFMTSEKHHPGYVLIPTATFERLRAASEAQGLRPEDDGPEGCIACGIVPKPDERVLDDVSGGILHVACAGPEREGYTGKDGEPLKDGEPIPQGRLMGTSDAVTIVSAEVLPEDESENQRRFRESSEAADRHPVVVALGGFLRTCSIGGMPDESRDMVADTVHAAARIGTFDKPPADRGTHIRQVVDALALLMLHHGKCYDYDNADLADAHRDAHAVVHLALSSDETRSRLTSAKGPIRVFVSRVREGSYEWTVSREHGPILASGTSHTESAARQAGNAWIDRSMPPSSTVPGRDPSKLPEVRPAECTFARRAEGKPSPKSGCDVPGCGSGGMYGCPYGGWIKEPKGA